MTLHTPVLMEEVLEYLKVLKNGNYIDCTFGGGGHTEAILQRNGPRGSMLALELDSAAIVRGTERLASYRDRLTIHQANFRSLGAVVDVLQFGPILGILYDFGLSMDLLKQSGRGFSFQVDEPLDMRLDVTVDFTAADLVNTWDSTQLADILYYFGDEQYARQITRKIIAARELEQIKTTQQLVDVIAHAVPAHYRHRKTHFATKSFQAIRMAVNDEIGAIETSLAAALDVIVPGGRIVVITFHSIEDRIVKRIFREAVETKKYSLPIKKPIIPTEAEIQSNPASRSAKLRVIEKL